MAPFVGARADRHVVGTLVLDRSLVQVREAFPGVPDSLELSQFEYNRGGCGLYEFKRVAG